MMRAGRNYGTRMMTSYKVKADSRPNKPAPSAKKTKPTKKKGRD